MRIYRDEQDEEDEEKNELENKRGMASDMVCALANSDFLTKFATSRQTSTEMGKTLANIAVAAVEQIYNKIT